MIWEHRGQKTIFGVSEATEITDVILRRCLRRSGPAHLPGVINKQPCVWVCLGTQSSLQLVLLLRRGYQQPRGYVSTVRAPRQNFLTSECASEEHGLERLTSVRVREK